jgi:ABC-type sugar transport system ATPase subunit
MTVGENITIGSLGNYRALGDFLSPGSESNAIAGKIGQLAIKTDGPRAAVTSLSGGNQQKCILARWLLINPKVLLLDEPTRGIDVGAKSEIYALIRRLVAGGMAIIMTSSELPELLAVSDRILVLCEGRATAMIPRAEATEEGIMHAATQFLDRGVAV